MSRQSCICRIDELHQLRAVAFELKPASHQLKLTPLEHDGPLAEWIQFNAGNAGVFVGSHRRFYPSANDGVQVFYANAA